MKIERYYYQKELEEVRQVEEEIAKREACLTEEERRQQADKKRREAALIKSKNQEIQNNSHYETDEKLVWDFISMYLKMLSFARDMYCDIIIESDMKKYGEITLKTDYIFFDECMPERVLPIFVELLEKASATSFHAEDSTLVLQCYFSLESEKQA